MGKKSQISNPVLGEDRPDLSDQVLAEQEAKDIAIENVDREKIDEIILSNDLQKGGKIRLERKGPIDQNYQYICTLPAEQWDTEKSLEWLKKLYGGGDYQARTFRANGQMYKPFSFSIDYRIKGKLDDDEIRRISGDNAKGSDSMAAKMLDMIQRPSADGFTGSSMVKMMELTGQRGSEMMTLVMTMMMKSQETMATVLAAALSNRGSGIDPVMLELLRAKQERPPMMEIVEAIKAIRELSDTNAGKEKEMEPDDMMSKITKLIGVAAPVLGGMFGGAANGNGAKIPASPAIEQGQGPAGAVGMMPVHIRMMIDQLLKAAARGSDPGLYADLIIDNATPAQLEMLKNILTDEKWCGNLWGDEARVASVRPWLENLKQLILSYEPNSVSNTAQTGGGEVRSEG